MLRCGDNLPPRSAVRAGAATSADSSPSSVANPADLDYPIRRAARARHAAPGRARRALAAHGAAVRARSHQPVAARGRWRLDDRRYRNRQRRPTRAHWEQIFATTLDGRPVRRVLVTHYHPDHAGNAAWLCERFGVPLWMTRGEFLTVHAVHASVASYTAGRVMRRSTVATGSTRRASRRSRSAAICSASWCRSFPLSHRRIVDGAQIDIDGSPGASSSATATRPSTRRCTAKLRTC